MRILLREHCWLEVTSCAVENPDLPYAVSEASFATIKEEGVRMFKRERNRPVYPFILQRKSESHFRLQADYYVGVDWLIPNVRFVQVEPKVNSRLAGIFNEVTDNEGQEILEDNSDADEAMSFDKSDYIELDYLKMLLEVLSANLSEQFTNKLVVIDWDAPRIPITQKEDCLTPFLVVQFLQLLKTIVRKGLKKSYYKVQENLENRVKGKILLGAHLKQNVFKSRVTKTYCEYQVFGIDNVENRFLKKVFRFASSYVAGNRAFLGAGNIESIDSLLNYCRPVFEHIGEEVNEKQLEGIRHNPFFKEYREAVTIGAHILKRFAYNLSEIATEKQTTPPFWIDMPKLFELYSYVRLLKANPGDNTKIHYQFSTYGNALDILVSKSGYEMVIDTKYKLHYKHSQVHQDIRQVAGYARLNKVREKLDIKDDRHVDCLIIYPDISAKEFSYRLDNIFQAAIQLPAYHKVWKLGVPLPLK